MFRKRRAYRPEIEGCFDPLYRDLVFEHLRSEIVDDAEVSGDVSPIVTRDGRERQIEWNAKAIKDAGGEVMGVLWTGQDITDRKRAEEAEQTLKSERRRADPVRFDKAFLRALVSLTHPDKHEGSKKATEVTKRLLSMRSDR